MATTRFISLRIDENTMGYINYAFFIRMAVLGGALSLLPSPVLAETLSDDLTAPNTANQLDSDANKSQVAARTAPDNSLSSAAADVLLPAAIASAASPAFVGQASVNYGVSRLTQVSQLPALPTDELADDVKSTEPLSDVAAVESVSDEIELSNAIEIEVDEPLPIEDASEVFTSIQSGNGIVDTTQAEPVANDASPNDGSSQLTQLPNLPADEAEADAPSDGIEDAPSDDVEVDEALPLKDVPEASTFIESGEIIPDTGQAESTAVDDLLTEGDLPPTELLADPNPLSVPTLESEVSLPEADAQTISIEEAIELAYFNNQDLQAALLELEQSEAVLAEARAAFVPVVAGSADLTTAETQGGTDFFGNSIGGDGLDTSLNADLQVTYDIFTSGQRSATVQAAKEQVRLSELEVERRREELRLNTTTLYYDLQESGEQIRINQAFVDEAAQNRRDNALRQEAGVGTTFDVLRADVQLANAQQDLIQSQSQQRIARRNLARLLNVPSTVNLNATPVPEPESWEATYDRWELTLEDSILLAFEGRAELEQQLAQREIGTQQARAARAANRPQVSLFANYSLRDLLDDSSDNYNFGARLNWLFVDGGAAKARARQQEANADIAEERFSEVLDSVRFEVEQAYFTMRSNEENVRTARTAIAQAVRALDLANLRLDAGVGTQLDVLTAQSELSQAEGNWVSAALGYNRALASLQRAVSNLRSTL